MMNDEGIRQNTELRHGFLLKEINRKMRGNTIKGNQI
jgi:hypothetical protein